VTRYREWWSARAGAIVWTRTVQAGATTYRVLPDGCLDLIWVDGALIVAGPAVLGVPAHELRDRRVPLDARRSP